MNIRLDSFEEFSPAPERCIISMGCLMQLLQIMPAQLKVLMEQCDVKFSQLVDGVGYLTVDDAEKVAEKCRDHVKEMHDVCESAKYN